MPEMGPRLVAARGAATLMERRCRRSDRAVGLVIMHHEVAPAHGDPEHELLPALGRDVFEAQLEYLGRHYEVVPLRGLVDRARQRVRGQRIPATLTFDDDLTNHVEIVAPLLERFGFPATFFLNGNALERPSPFWWQDLQVIINRGPGAVSELRRELAGQWPWAGVDGPISDLTGTIEALPASQRDAVAARLRELAGDEFLEQGLRAEAIRGLAERGFEIGVHTRRHYALPTLDDDELERAMHDGVEELEAAVGYRPSAIGYPHGKADLRVADAARRAGFDLGAICTHQAAGPEQHPLLLDRVAGWTSSLGQFAWALGRLSMA